MIQLMPFCISQLSPLLALWNQCQELDWANAEKLAFVLFSNENYAAENTLTAWEDDRMLGFLLGIRRRYPYLDRGLQPETAWILCQATAPEARNCGVGSLLLKTMEERWKKEGVKHIVLSAFSPYYFFPGIQKENIAARDFFEAHGYARGSEAYWMERSLNALKVPEGIRELKTKKEAEGYVYTLFSWEYTLPLLEFAREYFSTGWQHHIRQTILSGKAPEIVCLCLKDNAIAGYLQRQMDGDPCRLGPFGISPLHRNGGVGTVLLWEMFSSMYAKGLKRVYFQSTDEPGRRFYERQGMTVKRTYYHYEKRWQP